MDPCVWIYPFDLDDFAFDKEWAIGIEFRTERMMRLRA